MTEMKRLVEMIVDVVSNDYESYDNVLKEVAVWADEENIEQSDKLIINALRQAMQKGYVQAFNYSEQQQKFEAAEVVSMELPRLYFFATAQGRRIL